MVGVQFFPSAVGGVGLCGGLAVLKSGRAIYRGSPLIPTPIGSAFSGTYDGRNPRDFALGAHLNIRAFADEKL